MRELRVLCLGAAALAAAFSLACPRARAQTTESAPSEETPDEETPRGANDGEPPRDTPPPPAGDEPPRSDTALPPLRLSEDALAAGAGSEGSDDSDEEDVDDPILSPTARRPALESELEAEEEAARADRESDNPVIIDDDMELEPDPPELPEFRLRAGAGAALPTAGDYGALLRLTQDFEWQPTGLQPFFFGVDGAENLGQVLVGNAHARVGLHAWFCEERPLRCQASVALVVGAAFGGGYAGPDITGDTDLRLLLWDHLELHARGSFFFLGGVAFINITGGLGVAF